MRAVVDLLAELAAGCLQFPDAWRLAARAAASSEERRNELRARFFAHVSTPADPASLGCGRPTLRRPLRRGGNDPAWYDGVGQISKAITDWFNGLVHDGLSAVLDLLAHTALVTPDLSAEPRIR